MGVSTCKLVEPDRERVSVAASGVSARTSTEVASEGKRVAVVGSGVSPTGGTLSGIEESVLKISTEMAIMINPYHQLRPRRAGSGLYCRCSRFWQTGRIPS